MAKNLVYQSGRQLPLAKAGITSGSPVLVGCLTGVALGDTDAAGNITLDMGGVYNLSVHGVDDAGNKAIAIGDPIYLVDADNPKLSAKASGFLFGFALEAVNAGATTTIKVLNVAPTARQRMTLSAEQTGTGAAQNVAHGLAAVPKQVLIVPTDLTPATVGQYSVVEGAHTNVNAVVTVTTGKKFKVLAIA